MGPCGTCCRCCRCRDSCIVYSSVVGAMARLRWDICPCIVCLALILIRWERLRLISRLQQCLVVFGIPSVTLRVLSVVKIGLGSLVWSTCCSREFNIFLRLAMREVPFGSDIVLRHLMQLVVLACVVPWGRKNVVSRFSETRFVVMNLIFWIVAVKFLEVFPNKMLLLGRRGSVIMVALVSRRMEAAIRMVVLLEILRLARLFPTLLNLATSIVFSSVALTVVLIRCDADRMVEVRLDLVTGILDRTIFVNRVAVKLILVLQTNNLGVTV